MDYWTARALLEWQVEMGVDEAILDTPINRYEIEEKAPVAKVAAPISPVKSNEPPAIPVKAKIDPVAEAEKAARAAESLESLAASMRGFEHCDLKKGARSFVFFDGNPRARVMIIGEAPGREEDKQGKPFVGKAGQLLDRMFAAIGLSRHSPGAEDALYISNVLPWRPPGNRTPEKNEIAMMLPFLKRHVELADPDLVVLMGNTPCQALLGQGGITRIRGSWTEALGKPVMPMLHPAYLLRQPAAKRESWADLLSLRTRLKSK